MHLGSLFVAKSCNLYICHFTELILFLRNLRRIGRTVCRWKKVICHNNFDALQRKCPNSHPIMGDVVSCEFLKRMLSQWDQPLQVWWSQFRQLIGMLWVSSDGWCEDAWFVVFCWATDDPVLTIWKRLQEFQRCKSNTERLMFLMPSYFLLNPCLKDPWHQRCWPPNHLLFQEIPPSVFPSA